MERSSSNITLPWFCKWSLLSHYDEEPERIPFVKKVLEDKRISECIAIEGFCALHLIDDIPKYSVSFGDSKNCFLVNKKDTIINHSQIEKTELIE